MILFTAKEPRAVLTEKVPLAPATLLKTNGEKAESQAMIPFMLSLVEACVAFFTEN